MPETCPSATASVPVQVLLSVSESAVEALRRLTECIAERGLSPAEANAHAAPRHAAPG